MRFSTLLMTIVLAALCFGGSFTCTTHDDHHDHHHDSSVTVNN